MKDILLQVTPALTALVATLLVALLTTLTRWVHVHTQNKLATGIVDRATSDIITFVRAQAQIVDSIPRNPDGSLDPAKAAEAKAKVIADLKAMWGKDGLDELMKVLGLDQSAFGLWLEAQIESAVRSTPSK